MKPCPRCREKAIRAQAAYCRPCRSAVHREELKAEPAPCTLDDMIDDTLLADRPRLRMEVERLAREGAVFYLNPAIQEETDYNMLRLLYVTC